MHAHGRAAPSRPATDRTWPSNAPPVMPSSLRRRRIVSTRAGCSTWPSMRWPGATAEENTTRGMVGGAAAAAAARTALMAATLGPGQLAELLDALAGLVAAGKARPLALSPASSDGRAARSEPAWGIFTRNLAGGSRGGSLPRPLCAGPPYTACAHSAYRACAAAGRIVAVPEMARGRQQRAGRPLCPTSMRSLAPMRRRRRRRTCGANSRGLPRAHKAKLCAL